MPETSAMSIHKSAAIAAPTSSAVAPTTAGVVTPASALYTQADQTALANGALSDATQINNLRTDLASAVSSVNAIRAALQAAGVTL